MKLVVVTSAFFPMKDIPRQLSFFLGSCMKYEIDGRFYGVDQPYCIWADMKIKHKIPFYKELIDLGATHVLYTDSRDAFFTGPLDEIVGVYKRLGSPPCFASTEKNCNPNSKYDFNYPSTGTEYRYHCVGGYIAELPYIIEIFQRMMGYRKNSGDDAEIWQWAWAEGWFRPVLDSNCEVFQCGDRLSDNELQMVNGRLVNTITHSSPHIFHLNGGYSDPWRAKYDAMLPWWKMIHPEIDIPDPGVKPQ